MEIIYNATSDAPRLQREPHDNAPRWKQNFGSDNDCAALLAEVLLDVPVHLNRHKHSELPLLNALQQLDAAHGTERARELLLLAAAVHRMADERRTAEYLLRNRERLTNGRRSPLELLRAARYAAEMDLRRANLRELPVSHETLAGWRMEPAAEGLDAPSVGELVVEKLRMLTGHELGVVATARIHDAVVIAVELAERHAMNRGKGPSLLAMRADARKQSRLVTHLRAEFRDEAAAAAVARLLVGPDGSPLETALLWWSAQRNATAADVPAAVRRRWVHYVRAAGAVSSRSHTGRRSRKSELSTDRDR